MENKFSFPAPGTDSDQFEFGPVTTPSSPKSPADHLFFNGKLLPHVFPVQTLPNNYSNYSYSRSTSRASSMSSREYSLMSSRSNSTNSRSSNCSSARTSTSTCEAADLQRRSISSSSSNVSRKNNNNNITRPPPVAPLKNQHGATSQRWQLIAAAPVLNHQGSRSRNKAVVADQIVLERKGSKKSDTKLWFGRRILKSFVSACKECHAIKI
ncbi:hypothetical protein ACP275_13G079100 [Erythranthe tilingii]